MSGHREHRRFLPHFQNDFRTYFVTFCTLDRWILPPVAREIVVREAIAGEQYSLHTCVVMPDHVHMLLTPFWNFRGEIPGIGEVVRRLKGRSARIINIELGREGGVWQREYFDRELRNDEDIRAKGEYIAGNPVRAGLVETADRYRWLWREWVDGTG